ncbi:MAG: ABC transporter substrate-binding protein [Trueperaceae bacterium]|nr:ABC transporter substrate-binding protein [Trueperaceae bacterium]
MLIRTVFCTRLGVRVCAAVAALAVVIGTASAQTLRVGIETPVQLDPAFASADSEILVVSNVYDYLVEIDASNDIQPGLAESWTVSEDGTTWTFTLREGVTFHDGSDFTAEDVVWTFERLADPDADLPTSDLYAGVTSVEATGTHEVTFTLEEPNPFFLYDLSDNHAVITPAGSSDLAETFTGTGPFEVTSYAAEDRMVLAANEDSFAGAPGVDEIELIFFSQQSAAVNALRGGQVDVVMRMSTPLYQSLEGAPGVERVRVPTNGFDLVRLRTDREPGSDPRVVQALKLAVDRETIVEVVTDGLGELGADNPVGPLYEAYHLPELTPPARDVDRARELLAEAGYEDGLELVLHVPDSGDRPDLAVVLKEQLDEAGFDIEVRLQPESVYYGDGGWLEVDFGITGWGSRPVPQFYFDTMIACDAQWNEAHYCNDEVDALIETAGTTLDEEERTEAYGELQRILAAEGPYVIPYFFPQFGAVREGVQGFDMKAFPGRTDLATITLE